MKLSTPEQCKGCPHFNRGKVGTRFQAWCTKFSGHPVKKALGHCKNEARKHSKEQPK